MAALAYNLLWSWTPGGAELFAAIDQDRWDRCGHNPVRLLSEAPVAVLADAASRGTIVTAANDLVAMLQTELNRPAGPGRTTSAHPVAFFCAEYAVHTSLPIYSGGLGVLPATSSRRRRTSRSRWSGSGCCIGPATSTSASIEHEIVPLFHDRDEAGIPRGWVAMIKRSLRTIGPLVCGGRMLRDYRDRIYSTPDRSLMSVAVVGAGACGTTIATLAAASGPDTAVLAVAAAS